MVWKNVAYLSFAATGHQSSSTPSITPNPGEVSRHVVTVHGTHELAYLLVTGEHYHTCKRLPVI